MPLLQVHLLGTPQILRDGQLIAVQRRIQRGLLYYLAAHDGLIPRDELIALFWPEERQEVARRHLREGLSKLRADLGDEDYLISDHGLIGLNPQLTYSDVREFRQIVNQVGRVVWQHPRGQPLPSGWMGQLNRAVSLWRGPHFLSGASLPSSEAFDRWLTMTALDLEAFRIQMYERLVDHYLVVNDLEAGESSLRRILEVDEFQEQHQVRLIQVLRSLGRYSEAQRLLRTYQERYQREMGTELPQQLRELEHGAPQASAGQPGNRPVWPVALSMQVPMVDREKPLAALRSAFFHGGAALVTGESGSGKTRLIQELYYTLNPAPRLLLAPARQQEQSLPFQPWIEMLRTSIRPEEWEQLDPVWLRYLSLLLPELLSRRPALSAARLPAGDQAQTKIFEAFRQLFLQLARSQRLLVFLDDAQWADEASLSMLAYLVERSFFQGHGFLILAARSEDHAQTLERILAIGRFAAVLQRIHLDELNQAEVFELIQYAMGQAPDPDLVQQVVRDTGGNPLFVLETVRSLVDQGQANPTNGSAIHAQPTNLQRLIGTRIRALDQRSRSVIETAAILGSRFDVNVLAAASHLPPEVLYPTLEALERAHLILPVDQTAQSYRFIHQRIREVLVQELNPTRRRLEHLRAAQSYETVLGPDDIQQASRIARHYEHGGDLEKAFQYWLKAATYARDLYSWTEARAAYEAAEHLLAQPGAHSRNENLYQLYGPWSEMARSLKDGETLERIHAALMRYGSQRQQPLLMAVAMSSQAASDLSTRNFSRAMTTLLEALPMLHQVGHREEEVKALIRLGTAYLHLNRLHDSLERYEEALTLSQQDHLPALRILRTETHANASLLYSRMGLPLEGMRHAESALALCTRWCPASNHALACHAFAQAAVLMGRLEEAAQRVEEGLSYANEAATGEISGLLHLVGSQIALLRGDLITFEAHNRDVFREGDHVHSPHLAVELAHLRGDLHRLTGQFELAAHEYRRAVELSPANSFGALDNLYYLGVVYAAMGDPEQARALIHQALEAARTQQLDLVVLRAELALSYLQRRTGDLSASIAHAHAVEEATRQRQLLYIAATARVVRLWTAIEQGQREEVLAEVHAHLEEARNLQDIWLEIHGCSIWSVASAPNNQQAVAELQAAVERLLSRTANPALEAGVRRYIYSLSDRFLAR